MIGASFVTSLLFKVTIALLLTLGAARLARRSRAAVRHVLLATGFAALLVLPIASLAIRPVPIEVPVAAGIEELPAVVAFMDPGTTSGPSDDAAPASPRTSGSWQVPVSAVLVTIWSAGVLVFLLPVFVGLWQMRSLKRAGLPWRNGQEIVRQLALEAGVRRRVALLLHDEMPGPVTCGFFRPAIVLPLDARTWDEEALRRAIVHELEHVRRGDWATQCLARVLCAAYWCHPLAWIAWRRLGLEAERACDDAVLRRAEATSYADQLVVLAQRLSADTRRPLLAMASRADLTARVRAVLDAAQARGRAGAVCVAATLAIAALLVTAMAPLHAVLGAQSASAGSTPSFEVASIRRNTSGAMEQFVQREPGGRFSARNMPLRTLITFAYQIQGFQLKGGPDWLTSDRFDIVAKTEGEPLLMSTGAADPLRLMLRKLLADRFKLMVHEETQELPVFDLVLANREGKPGPQLRRSETDCAAQMAAALAKPRSGAPPPAPAGPNSPLRCGVTIGPGSIRFGGNPVLALANSLAPLVQRVVIDRTGLTGAWDFELTYTPDPGQGLLNPLPPGVERPAIDPNGPSLFTALEEQLGLRLNSARGPVTVIVIDSVEPPTPD